MEKTNKNGLLWGLIIIMIAIVIVIFVGTNGQTTGKSVKVGVVLPLTGGAADYGLSSKNGINLAVKKASQDYGITFEVIFEDSQADPKLAVSAVQKLINVDGVKYVIGFSSGEILAMCPITDANNIILLTPATNPSITTKCGDYTFRNSPSDIYQGKVLADMVSARGYSKVAVLYINNDYGVGLKDEFIKNYTGTISDVESHKANDIDFRTQLTKISNSKPEAIILISHVAEALVVLKQKTELGIRQPIFGADALKDSAIFGADKKSLENLYISFISQYEGKEFKEYSKNYLQKYGTEFGAFSDLEYDNLLTLASAMSNCKNENGAECVKNQIYKTNFVGATGLINYDNNGDRTNKDYTLYKIENNDFVPVQ